MHAPTPHIVPVSRHYPFSAVVGQPEMKRALLLVALEPDLGGVLLAGEKGTAKSTAARALAHLLPPITVVEGCPFGCEPAGPLCPDCRRRRRPLPTRRVPTPFVELPLGAGEDRLAGSLDLEAAIRQGRARLSPGLLARAHRGILYIDEVNLLAPHLVHLILDAAAGGVHHLEREGLSRRHPARFALVGSMNPEEGPLSPQLSDRFGLCVEVRGERNPALRRLVITRRLAWEADPVGFAVAWSAAEERLRRRLAAAREHLKQVELTPAARAEAALRARLARAAGQRAEIAMCRAARALAAWWGEARAEERHVAAVAAMALRHRRRPAPAPQAQPQARLKEPSPEDTPQETARVVRATQVPDHAGHRPGPGGERTLYVLSPAPVRPIATRLPAREGTSRTQPGRRSARQTETSRGRYVRASSRRRGRPLALDATFRAAAPHQPARQAEAGPGAPALIVREPDLREKVCAARRGRLVVFCVDASGSMNAAARMRETKAAVLGLLTEAYQKRDRVGLVVFGGLSARELLPPTSSVEVARRLLAELPTGGKTPLAAGLVCLAGVLERELARDPRLTPLALILTDGRPNVPLAAQDRAEVLARPAGNKGGGWGDGWGDGGYADREVLQIARRLGRMRQVHFVVVDIDTGHHHEINLCRPLADYLGAPCVSLRRVSAQGVLEVVRRHR